MEFERKEGYYFKAIRGAGDVPGSSFGAVNDINGVVEATVASDGVLRIYADTKDAIAQATKTAKRIMHEAGVSELRKTIREELRRLNESAPGSMMKMKLDKLKNIKRNLKTDVDPRDLTPKAESKFVDAQGKLNQAIRQLESAMRTFRDERRNR